MVRRKGRQNKEEKEKNLSKSKTTPHDLKIVLGSNYDTKFRVLKTHSRKDVTQVLPTFFLIYGYVTNDLCKKLPSRFLLESLPLSLSLCVSLSQISISHYRKPSI